MTKQRKPKTTRVPKTRNGNTMTESAFWQMIRATLRSRTRWWIPRLNALKDARRNYQGKNKRQKWEFKCADCEQYFPQKMIEVHHSNEVGQLLNVGDLPLFIERLFAEDGWVCLCKNCHLKRHQILK